MEQKQEKKNIRGWIAIGLSALSLLLVVWLVVYPQLIRPAVETHQAKQAETQEETQHTKDEEEKQSEGESLFSPEEDWTVGDYDQALKEATIDFWNNDSMAKVIGYTIEPGNEQTVKFYDCYMPSEQNSDINKGFDLVVRYTIDNPSQNETYSMEYDFVMDDYEHSFFVHQDRFAIDTLEDFIDYITSKQDSIDFGFRILGDTGDSDFLDPRSEGSYVRYTTEDFADLADYVPATEKE